MATALRFAARSDVGLLRDGNEDSGYAGPRLLAVADGVGGHVAGEVASSLAIATLAALDEDTPGPDLLSSLRLAVAAADSQIGDMIGGDPALEGMGTTLTALLRTGSRLAVVHVGDSRSYLLRDGALEQITHDHTFVQSLVDEGRITREEAGSHPQRNLITRALSGHGGVDPDVSIREARPGDRYLVCSDGLSGVVSDDTIHEVLTEALDPEAACEALVSYALRAGGPDNVTVVVADVVDTGASPSQVPQVVGAVAAERGSRAHGVPPQLSSAQRAAALRPTLAVEPTPAPEGRVRIRWPLVLALVLALVAVAGGGWAVWSWSQRQYYVGAHAGEVAIYRGLPQSLGGLSLSSVLEDEGVALADLPPFSQQKLNDGIAVDNLGEARARVAELGELVARCRATPALAECSEPTGEDSDPSPASSPASSPATSPASSPAARPVSSPAGSPS